MKFVNIILLFFLLSFQQGLSAAEVITSFHSDIDIQRNGELRVLETIQVIAEGDQIRRGIYRDFPTLYQDEMGIITRVGFDLVSVMRDGQAEDYHLEKKDNGIRIYIGNRNVMLKPAAYTYQIEYRTDRQLGFFKDFAELYFNVTGNGWYFPILQASASVSLPEPVTRGHVNLNGYTGIQGSTQQNLTHSIQHSDLFYFVTTQPLKSREGLTIVANWPRGIVEEPGEASKRQHFMEDNQHSITALVGLAIVVLYYFAAWTRFGKDPEKGVILPLYQPPSGFSPASTRFIQRMGYDKSCFTAAIVNLTVKGFISIQQNDSAQFILTRKAADTASLAAGEAVILDNLFEYSEQITLDQSEHKRLGKAINQHEASLRTDYEKLYFMTNRRLFLIGIGLSVVSIILSFSQIPGDAIKQSTVLVSVFTIIPFLIVGSLFHRSLKKRKPLSVLSIAVQIIFLGVFFFAASDIIAQIQPLLLFISWPVAISFYLFIAFNFLFQQWLKAPTLAGRKLLDKIESFKLYLSVAEEDEIKLSGQPRFSSDIYQTFLPYALALGVDHAWSQKLERSITAGLVEKSFQPEGFLYRNALHGGYSGFSDTLSSNLDSAISAASTAPGSSSGSSGGSSGGGGGGGGGGGW